MILGFNSDVRHRGKTFHVQTEDSGPVNPVIVTHVFLGGTILGTKRLDYGDALDRDDGESHVRALMKNQHKDMMKSLMAGDFDEAARRPQKAVARNIPLAKDAGKAKKRPLPPPLPPAPPAPPAPASVPAPAQERASKSDTVTSAEPIDSDRTEDFTGISLSGLEAALLEQTPQLAGKPATYESGSFVPISDDESEPVIEFPTDLVSGEPLDDVVLAFLAEDVERS